MKKIIKGRDFEFGYNAITRMGGDPDMLMDFGILRLCEEQVYKDQTDLERAILLVSGEVKFRYNNTEHQIKRDNCFESAPWVLHLPAEIKLEIIGVADDSELAIIRTTNPHNFEPKLYDPKDSSHEVRGAGSMQETSTRIVRTTFNHDTAPHSNLVIGEVICFPGKWSSFPPHHHPQPEIYFYKTNPSGGHAYGENGDDVFKLSENDTMLIQSGMTHPHVSYPGYALWYLWVIRHLDGNPYDKPTFDDQFTWVADPKSKFWPEK